MKQKCFQITTKRVRRSQQFQLRRQPVPCSRCNNKEGSVANSSTCPRHDEVAPLTAASKFQLRKGKTPARTCQTHLSGKRHGDPYQSYHMVFRAPQNSIVTDTNHAWAITTVTIPWQAISLTYRQRDRQTFRHTYIHTRRQTNARHYIITSLAEVIHLVSIQCLFSSAG